MWDMMSRGSFNGPGGQHTRWQIPPTQGAALGSQHNLRNKRFLNFIADGDILRLNRAGLAQTGLAVTEVKAREVAPNGDLAGVRINLDSDGDRNKICLTSQAGWTRPARARGARRRRAPPGPLQRLHDGGRAADRLGLLRAGPRRADRQVEDRRLDLRHLQLLRLVHRLQPAGHRPGRLRQGRRHVAKATLGDERQLNDGTFNAGVNSGGEYEYGDRANKPALLHPRQAHRRAGHPALHGRRAVARRRGPADARRGLATPARAPPRATRPARSRSRTRAPRRRCPTVHPQDAPRTSARTSTACRRRPSGTGWTAHLRTRSPRRSSVSGPVPVYIEKGTGAATGHGHPTRRPRATRPRRSRRSARGAGGGVGGSVPATLALTLGAAASFGPFTPGAQKDYFASTTANVISTAGDATLSVADPSRPPPATWSTARSRCRRRCRPPAHRRHVRAGRRLVEPDAEDLQRAGLQRRGHGQLQAADQGQRRAAYGTYARR